MPIEKVKNEDGSEWTPITVSAEDLMRASIMLKKLGMAIGEGEFSKAHAAEHVIDFANEIADIIEDALEDAGLDPAECFEFGRQVGKELMAELKALIKEEDSNN